MQWQFQEQHLVRKREPALLFLILKLAEHQSPQSRQVDITPEQLPYNIDKSRQQWPAH